MESSSQHMQHPINAMLSAYRRLYGPESCKPERWELVPDGRCDQLQLTGPCEAQALLVTSIEMFLEQQAFYQAREELMGQKLGKLVGRVRGLEAAIHENIEHRTQELVAENARLHRDAHLDALTGLLNRRALDSELQQVLSRCADDEEMSVIVCDVAFFKRVNDAHGHPAGDETLRRVAGVLTDKRRRTDLLARWGGEEFLLVLPGCGMGAATDLAEQIRERMASERILFPTGGISVTLSLGVSTRRVRDFCWEEIVEEADRRLYMAKERGRNQVVSGFHEWDPTGGLHSASA